MCFVRYNIPNIVHGSTLNNNVLCFLFGENLTHFLQIKVHLSVTHCNTFKSSFLFFMNNLIRELS